MDKSRIDDALEKLTKKDQIKTDLVKLRYFTGLTCGKQPASPLIIEWTTAQEF
jgi:hypothetical protein